MTVRYRTDDGKNRIVDVTEIEIDSITDTDMTVKNGKLIIRG